MATDVKVSLTIEGTDGEGKKSSMKIPYINPNISNETMKDFAEMCAELSTDTYTGTTKTTEEDITDGGGSTLENVGYSFYPDDGNPATWNKSPAEFILKNTNGQTNAMFSIMLMSKLGDGYYSGARAVTFTGYKPKGSTLEFSNNEGIVRIKLPDSPSYSTEDGDYYQLQVHIAPTEQYAGGTIYLYFFATETDMEAI